MTYQEILTTARTCSGPYCKVCPVCNGRACKALVQFGKEGIPVPGLYGRNALAAAFTDGLGGGGKETVAELREVIAYAGVPFILKGIMTVRGAKKALEAGAAGIVVSNHGGRGQEPLRPPLRLRRQR